MKKIISTLIVVFVSSLLFSGCSSNTIEENQIDINVEKANEELVYIDYINEEFDIELKYPSSYEKKENYMGATVILTAPTSSTEIFKENLNVMVQDLSSQPMTLEEYNSLNFKQFEIYIPDFNLLTSEEVSISGYPGYKVTYTGTQGNFKVKWLQTWTVIENKAYLLTYTSETKDYDSYIESIEYIINSFKILN